MNSIFLNITKSQSFLILNLSISRFSVLPNQSHPQSSPFKTRLNSTIIWNFVFKNIYIVLYVIYDLKIHLEIYTDGGTEEQKQFKDFQILRILAFYRIKNNCVIKKTDPLQDNGELQFVKADMQGVHVLVCTQPVYFGSRLSLLLSVWKEVAAWRRLAEEKRRRARDWSGDLVGVKAGIDRI